MWLRCEFLWRLQYPSPLIRCKAAPSFTAAALNAQLRELQERSDSSGDTHLVPLLCARASCFA